MWKSNNFQFCKEVCIVKKYFFTLITIVLLFSLVGCKNTLTAPDGLIAKAREEIPVAEADTIDIRIVGSIEKEDGNSLVWFMSGNEHQTHYYLPMECILEDNDKYEYVKVGKPYERGMDMVVYEWQGGYAFLINNGECKGIQITDSTGTYTVEISEDSFYPFTFYQKIIPLEYIFFDASGNELN